MDSGQWLIYALGKIDLTERWLREREQDMMAGGEVIDLEDIRVDLYKLKQMYKRVLNYDRTSS